MKKTAICIGINYAGTANELPDCELDASRLAAKFSAAGWNTLVFQQMSFKQLKDLLINTQATQSLRDRVALCYSGHGTQIESMAEFDGYDEALVLWTRKSGYEILSDDMLAMMLAPFVGDVSILLDSCFSGGMTKKAGRIARYINSSWDNAPIYRNVFPSVPRRFYRLYASSEDETALSTGVGGLFTNGILTGLSKGRKTFGTLYAEAKQACGKEQTPRIELSPGASSLKRFF